jgi:4-aminobutyrate aminotransferase-like enzyme
MTVAADEVLKDLAMFEPLSVQGQAPVVWDHAEGVYVWDIDGTKYLDWSSGVLVANSGHGHPAVVDAIVATARKPLLFSYGFPTVERAAFLREFTRIFPRADDKAMLLSTGAEAIECAVKLARTSAFRRDGASRGVVVSFERGFHGRTMGAQLAGGSPALKEWLYGVDAPFVSVPFPDGFRTPDTTFASFLTSLSSQGVAAETVAAVIMESYQGGGASFAPVDYVQQLAGWCADNGIAFIADEVQSGFGRTGHWFAFEHYGITPDLVCCGKGISSSLPLSAVVGRRDLLDQFAPGSMSSTHGGHPLCCAAATANLGVMHDEGLVDNARAMGEVLGDGLLGLAARFPTIGAVHGKGLVWALHMVIPGSDSPDAAGAQGVVNRCVENGVMLFAPVGYGGASVKVCPPLTITADEIRAGLAVLEDALARANEDHHE